MNPDYKKYSLIELHDVRQNIDTERYPERYNMLLLEIAQRKKNPSTEPAPRPREWNEKDKASLLRVLMSICAIYFSWTLIQAYRSGSIWYKNDHEYFLDTQATGFYFVVIIQIIFVVTALYIVFKGLGKK